jgi:hypothetical protein
MNVAEKKVRGPLATFLYAIAITAGVLVGLAVLLTVAMGTWMWWSDRSAGNEAAAFCAPIHAGDSVAAIKARAEAEGARYGEPWADQPYHRFRFSGWGLHECQITAEGDRVTGKKVNNEAFD